MKYFYYLDNEDCPIRIKARRRPSARTILKRGTWIVEEYWPAENGKPAAWQIAVFPEITWGLLSQLRFIGRSEI